MKNNKTSLLRNEGLRTLLSSLICIIGGLLLGFVVYDSRNPADRRLHR